MKRDGNTLTVRLPFPLNVVTWFWNKPPPNPCGKLTWYNTALSLPTSVVLVSKNPANRPSIVPSQEKPPGTPAVLWSASNRLVLPLTPQTPSPTTVGLVLQTSDFWGGYKNIFLCRYAPLCKMCIDIELVQSHGWTTANTLGHISLRTYPEMLPVMNPLYWSYG